MTDKDQRTQWLEQAGFLTQALPHMRRYNRQTIVVKYGGHAIGDEARVRSFASDIVLLRQVGVRPVVVHGGGPQIGEMLTRLSIKSEFVDGLRVTCAETVEVAEMVLSGGVNKALVAALLAEGGRAVGLSGKDGGLIQARKLSHRRRTHGEEAGDVLEDLGFVGEPEKVDPFLLTLLSREGFIPVIAPIARGADGKSYNINADTVAGTVAGATMARRLLLLTDVPGILDKNGEMVREATVADVRAMVRDGTVSGGMIPKVETCIHAIEQGAEAAVILDGRRTHNVLLEMFTDLGAGTLVTAG